MALLSSELHRQKNWYFIKKLSVILHEMLNLAFQNFRPIFLKSVLFYSNTSSVHMVMFGLIFGLLTFGDDGVRVLAGPLIR